jgi:Domain of unknown function (DU1801)
MVQSAAATVDQYLAQLPDDRRAAIARVRDLVNANLPAGFEEGMLYGMIGWYVPLARFPETYNGQPVSIAGLASQKQYMALYLNGVYGSREIEQWFRAAWAAAGKKPDMGKSCVRFRSLDAIPLDVIGQTIARVSVDDLLRQYTDARTSSARTKPKPAAKKPAAKAKPAAKKPAAKAKAKKPAAKKPAAKAKKPAAKKPKR